MCNGLLAVYQFKTHKNINIGIRIHKNSLIPIKRCIKRSLIYLEPPRSVSHLYEIINYVHGHYCLRPMIDGNDNYLLTSSVIGEYLQAIHKDKNYLRFLYHTLKMIWFSYLQ